MRGARTIVTRRAAALALALVTALAILGGMDAHPAEAARIVGSVYTAESEDSLARSTPITLIYRSATDSLQHRSGVTDANGHFHFLDLPADTSVSYVVAIDHAGQEFLSSPIRFQPGQEEIVFNLMLSREEPAAEGDLPSGHPPVGAQPPPMTKPVRQPAMSTILVVLWLVLLFVGIGYLTRRTAAGPGEGAALRSPQVRYFVREIANLDIAHADGVIPAEEYRKKREDLETRLRALLPVSYTHLR
ncbi:MAG: hypothetical protein QUU85_07325, partial [Candidatus Eisenbacteria bacterium]|nr:hypothetical protein [Candidatus Eisenbacteria bacterium]